MRLSKAIEIKLQWRKDNYPPALADEMDADILSIEAMKRVVVNRQPIREHWREPLPGETEE